MTESRIARIKAEAARIERQAESLLRLTDAAAARVRDGVKIPDWLKNDIRKEAACLCDMIGPLKDEIRP